MDLGEEQNQMAIVSEFVHRFIEVINLSHVFQGKEIRIQESIYNNIWVNQKEKHNKLVMPTMKLLKFFKFYVFM